MIPPIDSEADTAVDDTADGVLNGTVDDAEMEGGPSDSDSSPPGNGKGKGYDTA